MHVRARRALQDTLTAIRLKKPLAECGYALFPNGERHLRSRARLATIYPPALLAETVAIARALHVLARRAALRVSRGDRAAGRDAGVAPAQADRGRARAALWASATATARRADRCPVPPDVRELIEHELALIAELRYEPYFLTVHDIVAFARSQEHPLPGPRLGGQLGGLLRARHHRGRSRRGCRCCSSASSAKERNEPPDIDVDFEHQRREEVMQYVYAQVRPRPRGARRDAHHLPAEERGARRRQGAGPRPRAGRPARRRVRVVGRPRGQPRSASAKPASSPTTR